jgi:hypothetical protein
MINQGPAGSINFYLNYKLIQSLGSFDDRDVNTIKDSANRIIVEALRQGTNLKFIKSKFWTAVRNLKEKDLNDEDSTIFAVSFFGLIKFNAIEEDADHEGILVMPLRKKKKVKKDLIIGNGKSCRTSLCLAAFWPWGGPFKH